MKLPKVSDYMDVEVHTLRPDTPIHDAVSFLLDNHVTGAPVTTEDGTVLGLLSEKDCLQLLAAGDDHQRPKRTVAEYMTRDVQTIPPTMNVYFAAGMFLNTHVRRFPVVADGKLAGAITRFDILRAIRAAL